MDGRRRRYVMHDVYFLDDSLGSAVFDRFGAAGVAIWMGFIAACKKNHVQGEMSYSTDVEALAVLGLPGLNMVNNDGDAFTLDEFWTLLAHHKVVRRRRAARRVHVLSTRWERWQHTTRTRDAGEQSRRSDPTNTDQTSDGYETDSGLDTETETETDVAKPKRAASMPDGWSPTEAHERLARSLGVDLALEVDQFRDHHQAKGSTMKDWDAAFRTWLRNAKKFERPSLRAVAGDFAPPARFDT